MVEELLSRFFACVGIRGYLSGVALRSRRCRSAHDEPWWRCSEAPDLAAQFEWKLAKEMELVHEIRVFEAVGHGVEVVCSSVNPGTLHRCLRG